MGSKKAHDIHFESKKYNLLNMCKKIGTNLVLFIQFPSTLTIEQSHIY